MFHQLTKENIEEIAGNMLKMVNDRIEPLGYKLQVEDSAVELLADKGFDPKYGARPLRRAIQSMVEDELAEKILEGAVSEGDTVLVKGEDGKIVIEKA